MKTMMIFPSGGRGSSCRGVVGVLLAFAVMVTLLVALPAGAAFVGPTTTTAGRRHPQHEQSTSAAAFTPSSFAGIRSSSSSSLTFLTRLHFFGRGEKENTPESERDQTGNEDSSKKQGIFSSFLNRKTPAPPPPAPSSSSKEAATTSTSIATVEATTPAATAPSPPAAPTPMPIKKEESEMTAMEKAQMLRAQAEKARLEAERMDAELTLQKITRLEKELAHERAKKKKRLLEKSDDNKDDDDDSDNTAVQDLQREMDALLARMRGEKPKPKPTSAPPSSKSKSISTLGPETKKTTTAATTKSSSTSSSSSASVTPWGEAKFASTVTPIPGSISQQELDKFVDGWKDIPDFMKKTMAMATGMMTTTTTTGDADTTNNSTSVADLNATELYLRTDQMKRMDYSFLSFNKPTFTKSQIEKTQAELLADDDFIKGGWFASIGLDPRLEGVLTKNATEAALVWLEYNYYIAKMDDQVEGIVQTWMEDEWFGGIINEFNKSVVDGTIETLYPKCTRKESKDNKGQAKTGASALLGGVPTMAQVQQLTTSVLPKSCFASTSKPEPVAGGYVIRGKITNDKKITNGDDLIRVIDEQLVKSGLADKMTVVYAEDFTIFAELEDAIMDADNALSTKNKNGVSFSFVESDAFDEDKPPILYVLGPNICREPRKVLLSITTAAGLATSWYLSIYPFLLNPALAKRVDEQLALADANMTPDLAWLTDLSVPLFTTFVGIMLCHEAGHRVVAAINGIKPTFPTFVPSIITGVTSTVTSFKEPPKNKQAMFDFSSAGPLFGMLASIAALTVGSQLTLVSDTGLLPALPLEILRQSSLGGGIINGILGNGVLNVPEGALGTQAVAGMTIPLHPVAVAGYLGLIVNALNVLPIGTTDGGRMALSLFGRGPKLLIGNAFMFAILLIGTLGSDLFLFYFAFCLAFQSGNEIPAKNEVDSVDFSRVIAGTLIYVLALLVLIPI